MMSRVSAENKHFFDGYAPQDCALRNLTYLGFLGLKKKDLCRSYSQIGVKFRVPTFCC